MHHAQKRQAHTRDSVRRTLRQRFLFQHHLSAAAADQIKLGLTPAQVFWLAPLYAISSSLMQPVYGFISDRYFSEDSSPYLARRSPAYSFR